MDQINHDHSMVVSIKNNNGQQSGLHRPQHLSASKLLLVLPVNTAVTYELLQVAIMGPQKPQRH